MADIRITEREVEALYELPHRAVVLYLLGLRPHMDYTTGIVGDRRKVSYQGFCELLAVGAEWTAEHRAETVSKKQARVSVEHLVKAGLVERLPTKKQRDPMRLRLVLAPTGSVRVREPGHSQGIPPRADQTPASTRDSGQARAQPGHTPQGTPPEDPVKPNTNLSVAKATSCAESAPAGAFDRFWSAYPIKRGKRRARDIWARKRLDARADLIVADVRRRVAEDDQWLQGYIPHPSTYLNGDRWEDELRSPARVRPNGQDQDFSRRNAETILRGITGGRA